MCITKAFIPLSENLCLDSISWLNLNCMCFETNGTRTAYTCHVNMKSIFDIVTKLAKICELIHVSKWNIPEKRRHYSHRWHRRRHSNRKTKQLILKKKTFLSFFSLMICVPCLFIEYHGSQFKQHTVMTTIHRHWHIICCKLR